MLIRLVFLAFVFIIPSAFAQTISLSKTMKVELAEPVEFLPAQGMRVLVGESAIANEKVLVQLRRETPRTLPNDFLVNKYWQKQISELERMGEAHKRKECAVKEKHVFECVREAYTGTSLHVYEAVIWNGNKDFLSIRISSKSAEAARKFFEGMRWIKEKK